LQYTDDLGNIQGGYYAPEGLSPSLQDEDTAYIVVISSEQTIEELKERENFEFVKILEEG